MELAAQDPREHRSRGELWAALEPPHWIAAVTNPPGTEAWLEAEAADGSRHPALVHRRFGAGQVLYAAFDESWRWRREVADRYHARFWNQAVVALLEAPFAVRDRRVALDADALAYRPGQAATLRLRLRDERGRLVPRAEASAVLFRDGQRVATLPFLPDEAGGAFRAIAPALDPGRYEVRVQVQGLPPEQVRATTGFVVAAPDAGELAQMGANEELMRGLAAQGGGVAVREEQIDRAVASLRPLSQGRIVESDTVLWQSYGWFAAVIGLLTVEWILRKREGLL
jgi:hypothetical protein